MYRFALFLLTAPLFAQTAGIDLVLLLEKTPGMPQPISHHQFRTLRPEDRVAVMTFADTSKVRQAFTNDPKKLEHALRLAARNPSRHGWGTLPKRPPQVRFFRSLLDAARLFQDQPADPSRRRVILTIFGTEDDSAAVASDAVRQALEAAHIRLYAVAIGKFDPIHARDSQIETPPTFPGRTPPAPTDRLPLPEKTLHTLQILASATGGQAVSGEANVARILSSAGDLDKVAGSTGRD